MITSTNRTTTNGSPQTWLVTSGMALIAVLYFLFGFLPGQKAMANLQGQLRDKHQAVALMDTQALQKQALETQLAAVESYAQTWKRTAINPDDLPKVMAAISKEAKSANVSIARLEPQKFPLDLQTVKPVTLAVTSQGAFLDCFDFVHHLEALPYPLWVQNLKVIQSGENTGSVRVELTLTIFANSQDYSDK